MIEINPLEIFFSMKNSEIFYRKTYFENESPILESEKCYNDSNFIVRTKSDHEIRRENLQFLNDFINYNNLSNKTYFLACIYYDYVLTNLFYKKYKNELKVDVIIISCGLLSLKFIENDPIVPNLRQIQTKDSLDNGYNIKEIIKYEELCIKLLNYKLDYILAYDYISLFFKIGIFTLDEKNTINKSIDNLYNKCIGILNEFSYDIKFPEYSQLEIALACISLIRETQGVDKWIYLFEDIYNVKFEFFNNCYIVLKKLNIKLFQNKVNTYKKTELFLNLNFKDIKLENLQFTPHKNKNSLSIFNFPNTTRDKKLKPLEYLYSQIKSTDLKEIKLNFSREHEHNEKEQQESDMKNNSLNSKVILKRDIIREILKESSISSRENLSKHNFNLNKEKVDKEKLDDNLPIESNTLAKSSIGKITSLLKKRTMTSLIDSNIIQNENSPDISLLIESNRKEAIKKISSKNINSNSSKIIPSLSKLMNIKKYQDSLTMNSTNTESNIKNKSFIKHNTIMNIKKDLFQSMKSFSINTVPSNNINKKTSCNIQEANTIYKKVNFFQKKSLEDLNKFSNFVKHEINRENFKTNFLKDRIILKKK